MPEANFILAALVNPALFWGGMAAMAAPVIIHLLARRRFRRVRWAAMRFLVDAEKRNRRRVRIEELILLLLRCLAILMIALVVSRPFVKPTGVASIIGGRERTERIFLIDDSFSMGYLSGNQSAFQRAKTSVVNLLGRLREHAPDDTVTILKTSQVDAPLVTGALLDDKQIEQILARLEALDPSQMGLSVEACMAGLRKTLEADPGIVSATIYVISDFQRIDWIDRGGASSEAGSLVEPLKKWAGADNAIRLLLVDVGDDDAGNLAVTQLRSGQRQIVTGVESRIEATVSNFTARTSPPLDIEVSAGQTARATARLEGVAAGRSAETEIPVVFQRSGDATVRVEIAPDDLPIDNVRTLAVEVNEAIRILVVNGESASDSYLDEVHLLTSALRPEGEVFSGNQVTVIEETDLDGVSFDSYHLVFLCNLYRVSEPVADSLHRFVFDGGGLCVFLGDQVTDPAVYNASLYRKGAGLLPGALQTVISRPDPGVSLAPDDSLHPVVRVFSGQDNPFRERVRFDQYFDIEPVTVALPGEDGEPDESDAGFRGSTNVIARFDDAEGTPAIMERGYGRGRVLLFASSADLEWNTWAKDPSYVVTMLEVAQYLARSSEASRSSVVGEPLVLELDPSQFDPSVRIRGPGFPQQPEEEVTASATDEGGMKVVWPHTDRAGVYTLVMRRRSGAELIRRFAVNLDERESDLDPAVEDELRGVLAGVPVDYVAGVASPSDEADEGRKELWPFLLGVAIAVLMVEQFLAWRFGKR